MKARHLFAAMLSVLGFAGVALTGETPVSPAAERDVQDFIYFSDKGPLLVRLHVRIDGKPLVEVWESFMGKLFAYLDVDGDGILNKTEAARVPPVGMLFSSGAGFGGQAPNIAQAIDRNQDGKITKQELADWYRRNGGAPFQFRSGGNSVRQTFRVIAAGQQEPLSPDALNDKLFALLDQNKDGKLSREELARAPAVLHKFDLDDDEMVSIQEMSGNSDRPSGDAVVQSFAVVQDVADYGPFFPVNSGAASKDLAQRLLTQYGRKGAKPRVTTLTRQELRLDDKSFAALDADEDGKLDREELARFGQREPDLELRVRLGKKADREAAIEMVSSGERPSRLAKSLHAGAGETVMLDLGSVQIELGRAETPQPAVAARKQLVAQFAAADRDNNGYLDRNEAMKVPIFRSAFTLMDRDGDGKLFEKEVVGYLDQMRDLQAAALRSCASLAIKDQGRGLFDLVDTNSDGRLGVRELRQMGKLIQQLDRDGDGRIARDEIPHKYRLDVRHGPASGDLFASNVLLLRRANLDNPPGLPERHGPRWFQKMDRNHDGDVSRREFLGTDAEFRKIDTDGDGLISRKEAQRADELFRKDKANRR